MLCVNAFLACCSCCISILTMLKLTTFLSTQSMQTMLTLKYEHSRIVTESEQSVGDKQPVLHVIMELMWIAVVVILFVLQHSLMACQWWKKLLSDLGIVTSQRALYVLTSCWTLQYMMSNLKPVHLEPLWYINTSVSYVLWLVFFLIHSVAWLLLYATCIIMDLPEMVGIRQVYYQYLDCEAPIKMKSSATCRLYDHMRHGGACCLLVVLWIHPLMTSTRLILAIIFTLYLLCGFSVCKQDYVYLREQIARKHVTFLYHRIKSVELLQ